VIIRSIRFFVFLAILALLGVNSVKATEYYVSSIRANRSDSNSGTDQNAPWATFDKVKSMWSSMPAGSTVHLERGSVWSENWNGSDFWDLSSGGSASGGYKTVRGDDYGTSASKPILRRTGGHGNSWVLIEGGANYIVLRDFVLDANGYAATGIVLFGADSDGISNIQILNMQVKCDGGTSSDYICGIWVATKANDCLIQGNDISGWTATGMNHYSDPSSPKTRIIWRNNRAVNTSSTRYDNAPVGMQIDSYENDGNIVEGNYIEDRTGHWGMIIFTKNGSASAPVIVRNNVIANCGEFGISIESDNSNGNGTQKILADIYGNVIYGTTIGRNNNSQGWGISFRIDSYPVSGSAVNIYNNTLYNNAAGGIGVWPYANMSVRICNNLIYQNSSGKYGLFVQDGYSLAAHNNNLFWNSSGSGSVAARYGSTDYTVGNVRNFESTAQNADPLFTSSSQLPTSASTTAGPAPGGLLPTSSSVALNTAASLGSAFATSINMVSRPQGAGWDIGAYEFGSAATPVATVPMPPTGLHVVP